MKQQKIKSEKELVVKKVVKRKQETKVKIGNRNLTDPKDVEMHQKKVVVLFV